MERERQRMRERKKEKRKRKKNFLEKYGIFEELFDFFGKKWLFYLDFGDLSRFSQIGSKIFKFF
jgi:hypothetical protein